MARRGPPVFLARERYRQRRLRDALWLMPVLGAVLFAVPLLWPRPGEGVDPARTSAAVIYLFSVWGALIALAAGLAGRLRPEDDDRPPEPPPPLPGPVTATPREGDPDAGTA